MNSDQNISRTRVTANLVTESPLCLRTGDYEVARPASDDDKLARTLAIDLDADRKPFIPASSFRGAFRAFLAATLGTNSDFDLDGLFGHEPRPQEIERNNQTRTVQIAGGGLLEFSNLTCLEAKPETLTVSQTAIDKHTLSADDAMLRSTKMVAAGTRFQLEIIADNLGRDQLAGLIAGLDAFGAKGIQLGAGAATGNGHVALADRKVFHMDTAAIAAWLTSRPTESWKESIKAHELAPDDIRSLTDAGPTDVIGTGSDTLDISLTLDFPAPFLVSRATPDGDADLSPFEFAVEKKGARKIARLPGSSLKGALRGQAERILQTLGVDADMAAQAFIEPLFGATGRRGALTFGHFSTGDDSQPDDRPQEFVAIDRVTGGARDGAKFNVARPDSLRLTGSLSLNIDRLAAAFPAESRKNHWLSSLGLLALMMRDLAEGDIPLGYGSRKGFGVPTLVTVASTAYLHTGPRVAELIPEGLLKQLVTSDATVETLLDSQDIRSFLEGTVTKFRESIGSPGAA